MNCGNNPVEVLNFFQASSCNCIDCVHSDDFSLLLLLLRVRAFLETFFFIKLSFFIVAERTQCQKGYQNFIPTLYGCSIDLRYKGLLYAYCLKKTSYFLDFTNKRHLRYVS